MTAGGSDKDLDAAVEAVLAPAGYAARIAELARMPPSLVAAAAGRLVRRAYDVMRTEPEEGSERARLALSAATVAGDAAQMLAGASAVAQASLVLGRYPDVLATADAALRRAMQAGLPESDRRELELVRVQALTHLERYVEAEGSAVALAARCDREQDLRGRIWARMTLADVAFRMDAPRKALRCYREVEALLPASARTGLRAALAANRANALEATNRFRAAARGFEAAKALFASAGEDHGAAQADYNAAYAQSLRGRYDEALSRYARVAERFTRLGDARHLAHIDLDRAEIHLHLHLIEDARRLADAARQRFDGLGLRKESALASLLLGRAARLAGDVEASDRELAQAQSVFQALGLVERVVGALLQRAGLAMDGGDLAGAGLRLREAQALEHADMNPLTRAGVHAVRARLALARGLPDEAAAWAGIALAGTGRALAPWAELDARWTLARAHVQGGQDDAALADYEGAIRALERYRMGVPPDEYMTSFLAGRSALYQEVVDLLVRRGDAILAFHYAERAKSRALVELLADRDARAPGPEADDASTRRIAYLRERLNAIYRRLAQVQAEPGQRGLRAAERALADATKLEDEVGRLLRSARVVSQSAALARVSAPSLADVQRDLEPGSALLEYVVTPGGLVAFAVTRDAFHVLRRADATEASLRSMLQRLALQIARADQCVPGALPPSDPALAANLQALADVLLADILDDLPGVERLVVVPHGILHQVPFHALPLGDGVLLDRFEVVYAPSADVYRLCGAQPARAQGPAAVFGLADATAPRIADEARHVAALLGTDDVAVGADATFERLRSACCRARVVHIATHGMFRPGRPMLSSVQLADRWMNLYDVYGLEVRGELVVLASCESGTADVSGGDEILGLTRGFLCAGAPALLTSQWRVDDDATQAFMQAFYAALAAGEGAAAAHRRAALEARARTPHPYHWAGFFLMGRPVAAARPPAARAERLDAAALTLGSHAPAERS